MHYVLDIREDGLVRARAVNKFNSTVGTIVDLLLVKNDRTGRFARWGNSFTVVAIREDNFSLASVTRLVAVTTTRMK
jgi:hypothetical protein